MMYELLNNKKIGSYVFNQAMDVFNKNGKDSHSETKEQLSSDSDIDLDDLLAGAKQFMLDMALSAEDDEYAITLYELHLSESSFKLGPDDLCRLLRCSGEKFVAVVGAKIDAVAYWCTVKKNR